MQRFTQHTSQAPVCPGLGKLQFMGYCLRVSKAERAWLRHATKRLRHNGFAKDRLGQECFDGKNLFGAGDGIRTIAAVLERVVAADPYARNRRPKPAGAIQRPFTPMPTAAVAPLLPAVVKFPQPSGTREERLRRLATAMGADERTLEAALDDGTTPDEFAIIASDEVLVKAKAREILEG